jgi:Planctomycete cytochrome C
MNVRVAIGSILCFSVSALAAAEPPLQFDQVVRPFLVTHCERCHGEKLQEGQLRVDHLSADFTAENTASRWGDVIERMSSGEMPPKDVNQTGWCLVAAHKVRLPIFRIDHTRRRFTSRIAQ